MENMEFPSVRKLKVLVETLALNDLSDDIFSDYVFHLSQF